jgi:hypothetical protein
VLETVLADKVWQGSLGRVVAVGQGQAILQVVEGQHDHGEPFLSGFKGLQTEIAQSQGIFQVSVINLNGLITNDKFCMVRTGKLKLNHWRLPLKRRIGVAGEKVYSAQQITECGGKHETPVEDPARGEGIPGWAEAMGSSLPSDPGNCSIGRREAADSDPGGEPCE